MLRRVLILLSLACLPAGAQERKANAKPIPAARPAQPPATKAATASAGESPGAATEAPATDPSLPPAVAPAAPAPVTPEVTTPPAPDDRIWDQTAAWSPNERKVAAAELNAAAVQLRFSVYLVNLNAPPDEQSSDLARRLAFAWTGSADRAVILTGPGLKPPVIIECVGESLGSAPPEQLAAFCAAAQAEAAKAPAGMASAMAAARSLIAQVNVFRTGGILGPQPAAAEPEPEQGSRNSILWLALGAICIVLLLAAAFFVKRRQTSALIFPPVEFRRRFSAPHSGGSNALVQFGNAPPAKPPGPDR